MQGKFINGSVIIWRLVFPTVILWHLNLILIYEFMRALFQNLQVRQRKQVNMARVVGGA